MRVKRLYLTTKDYAVSGEEFQLLYNSELDMLETFPRPLPDTISDYYISEDYISHTDSKRNLLERLYHFVRMISLRRKLKLINQYNSAPKNLLDFGCGTGDFLKLAQTNYWNVFGIEPNDKAREIANLKTNDRVFDSEKLKKFSNESFDVITLWHVLEHLPKIEEQILIFEKLLKHDGLLIIAVPNFKSYDAKYYKSFWAAYDVPRHLWHFSQHSISKIFHDYQFKVVKTHPMYFDSYYISLLSEKYKSGVMNPLKAFWIGWQSNLKAKRSTEYSSLVYIIRKLPQPI